MHIGIIMDGNRRWAKKRGMPKAVGHRQGAKNLEKLLDLCPKYDVDVLTVYALSTENLERSESELESLFGLIKEFSKKKERFKKNNVRVKIMGRLSDIREDAREALVDLEDYTADCDGFLFQICISYGGRDEIVRSVQKVIKNDLEVTEENISKNLDSNLEPDLIIRTGGHKRLSNFLIWQAAYSEFLFLEKTWPEFSEKDLQKATEYFRDQQRNFGK